MERPSSRVPRLIWVGMVAAVALLAAAAVALLTNGRSAVAVQRTEAEGTALPQSTDPTRNAAVSESGTKRQLQYQARFPIDMSGFNEVLINFRWPGDSSLEQIADRWHAGSETALKVLNGSLPPKGKSDSQRLRILLSKVNVFNFLGENKKAIELMDETRSWVETSDGLAELGLYTVIFFQGMCAMRQGETENCIMCRGDSSCMLPIVPAAVHTNPAGSRRAIRHFTEYLERFPDDLAVRWLLNLAHMTLGEHPDKVDPRYLIRLDHYLKSEFDIGKFRDVGHIAKVDRFSMNGAGLLEDFDNDGRLDLATTSSDPAEPIAFYHNAGDGTFEDRTKAAGLSGQLGGIHLHQTDFNNDGKMDVLISRGAWFLLPIPQSLMRNDGDGKFTDVTVAAGLGAPLNSMCSRWGDYDNDGWVDVFIVCEKQPNFLYRNRGDGTFEDVTAKSGLAQDPLLYCKGVEWIDYDNDDFPDLYVDNLGGWARLYHNNRDGTFTETTKSMGIDGPWMGFSCWAWDYDNDGWLDIFATTYDNTIADVVQGLMGQPHQRTSNRLYRNVNGKHFEDKTKEAGLDLIFAAMGSNIGDFDNDGFLDFYLGTGAPDLSSLVPNRMFKNVEGRRFSEITASSGTGNLQKGHGVSCGDWDRDGDLDFFIQMGGTTPGDRYHNLLFQNPGQKNHWLGLKLVGKKTNRAAIGARIKVVTAGDHPLTVYRHISVGSTWGANPLEQHIGLAQADQVALLEIHWPTSGTTQVFRNIAANQAIEVTEFATEYRPREYKAMTLPVETEATTKTKPGEVLAAPAPRP
jgi:ASPIC and UnbV/FG-GAP-like repeat